MTFSRTALYTFALTLALPVAALAQGTTTATPPKPKPKVESQATLAKQAKVSLADAKATALKKVPGATFKGSELEREKGKLIYSFELKVAGKSGIEEVNVDAMTGEIVNTEHEDDAPPKVKKP